MNYTCKCARYAGIRSVIHCNCIQLWCQISGGPLRLGKKAKTLDIHMHFCGFSLHSFFTLFFFLTTCGVIYIFFWLDRPFHSE